ALLSCGAERRRREAMVRRSDVASGSCESSPRSTSQSRSDTRHSDATSLHRLEQRMSHLVERVPGPAPGPVPERALPRRSKRLVDRSRRCRRYGFDGRREATWYSQIFHYRGWPHARRNTTKMLELKRPFWKG